jgi:hypothetical protein
VKWNEQKYLYMGAIRDQYSWKYAEELADKPKVRALWCFTWAEFKKTPQYRASIPSPE